MHDKEKHIIICGNSNLPYNILNEIFRLKPHNTYQPLRITNPPENYKYIVLSDDKDIISTCCDNFPEVDCIIADASDDEVLERVSIKTAHALIISYTDDRENLLITLSARQLNPTLEIVVTSSELETMRPKLIRAGANYVISSSNIGGMRMAAKLVRPNATEFINRFLFNENNDYTVEEIIITENDPNKNKKVADSEYAEYGLLIIAISRDDNEKINYNPNSTYHLRVNDILLILGHTADFKKLSHITHYGQFSRSSKYHL